MLANSHPATPASGSPRLLKAIKRVYASTFLQHTKTYVRRHALPTRRGEDGGDRPRAGRSSARRPLLPGLRRRRQAYNHYPIPPHEAGRRHSAVALGFGTSVVNGETCLRFSPRHPAHLPQYSSPRDTLRNSQREFHALDLETDGETTTSARRLALTRLGLVAAEDDGTLAAVGSTDRPTTIGSTTGVSRAGVRVVSFAPIPKHGRFPLAEVLAELLTIGKRGTSTEVEIEFAGTLTAAAGRPPELAFLQLRPMGGGRSQEDVDADSG